jgi:long-chain acyl-CoA synthetase
MLKATIDRLLVDAAQTYPTRTFLHRIVDGRDERTSYRDALPRIAATCDALRALGFAPGDRLVLHLEDQVELLYFLLSTAACGLIAVPIPPIFSTEMVAKTVARVSARGVFSTLAHAPRLVAAGIEPLCFVDGTPPAGVCALPTRGSQSPDDALAALRRAGADHTWSDPYIILSTSGTTSEPKLVVRPHTSVTSLAGYMALGLRAEDAPPQHVLMAAGLNHGIGQANLALALLLAAEQAIPTRLEADVQLEEVRRLDPTYVYCNPRVVNALLQAQRAAGEASTPLLGPGCRTVRFGGGPSTPELRRTLAVQGLDVGEIYAASETGSIAMTSRGSDRMQVLPDVTVRIGDDQEILVKTDRDMTGYHQAVPRPPESFTEDGFYRTGDRGALDPDGTLVFLARQRDLFNTQSGANVNPVWIEGMIEVLPWVQQVVLVGDRRPWLAALIVLAAGDAAGDEADGYLDPGAHPAPYARAQRELDELNARLEPIEHVQRFALFARALPDDLYASVSGGKTRRDRPRIGARYARRIEALYPEAALTPGEPGTR